MLTRIDYSNINGKRCHSHIKTYEFTQVKVATFRLPFIGDTFLFSKEFKPVANGNKGKTDKYGSNSTNERHD